MFCPLPRAVEGRAEQATREAGDRGQEVEKDREIERDPGLSH
jgi:hypothetical protein